MFSLFMRYFKMFNNVDLNSGSLKILSIYTSNNVAMSILYGVSANPLLTKLHISVVFSTYFSISSSYAMSHTFSFSHLHIVKQSIKRTICSLYIACAVDTAVSAPIYSLRVKALQNQHLQHTTPRAFHHPRRQST